MSLDSLLTFAGILIAIYAIANPVQRVSLRLFAPLWALLAFFFLAFITVIVPTVMEAYGVQLPVGHLLLWQVASFMILVGGASIAYHRWAQRRLTRANMAGLSELLEVSLREERFDEAKQVLQKNQRYLPKLPSEVLGLLYEPRMVRAFMTARSFLHLELLADKRSFEKMSNPFGPVDAVIRAMLSAVTSPLRSAVLSEYGGQNYYTLAYSDEDRELVKATLQNPKWFARGAAHAPLLYVALEELESGGRNQEYNQVGRAYEGHDGISTRGSCPIYLALKTNVLAIHAAVEQGAEEDVYAPGPQQFFHAVLERSAYHQEVWESNLADRNHPTPYAYLLQEITSDYRKLCVTALRVAPRDEQGVIGPPGDLVSRLALCWATCVWDVAASGDHVSRDFWRRAIKSYLYFVLQIRHAPQEITHMPWRGPITGELEASRDLFVQGLKLTSWSADEKRAALSEAFDKLDMGKSYVLEGCDELRTELGL